MEEFNIDAIKVGDNSLQELKNCLEKRKFSSITVIADKNTVIHCYPLLKEFLPEHNIIIIEPGEENKNIETCKYIWTKLTEFNTDRKGLVINLGGGVVGDLGGFAAQTFKRGIDFVQVPTSLLAMVDASIGGKQGIDFDNYKNQIGLFAKPVGVIVYPKFLETLPQDEYKSGLAEVIKHLLIEKKESWQKFITSPVERDIDRVIDESIIIKSTIVKKDPNENDIRKSLNFGHTIGHALESYFLDKEKISHGKAVAIGMICESYLSHEKGFISKDELKQISRFLLEYFGKTDIPKKDINKIALLTLQDKKNQEGNILMVLLKEIGKAIIDQKVSIDEIEDAIRYYQKL